jgi:CTP-dependent riboflavin kinase
MVLFLFSQSSREPRSIQKMKLEGTIISGWGAARGVIARWLPVFAHHHSELANSYPGTINIDVGFPIDFLKIDFRTPSIGDFQEVEFVRVRLEFPIGNILDAKAWIYQPYGFHWGERNQKNLVEILVSRHIEGVKPGTGQRCRIDVLNKNIGETSTSPQYKLQVTNKKDFTNGNL